MCQVVFIYTYAVSGMMQVVNRLYSFPTKLDIFNDIADEDELQLEKTDNNITVNVLDILALPNFDNVTASHRVVMAMALNATFNNISVISWRSVLLVEETGLPGANH